MTRLQVRQLQLGEASSGEAYVSAMGAWHDITSPMWLIGFILPHPGIAYEFRNAPEDE
jgi:hypothetical protein